MNSLIIVMTAVVIAFSPVIALSSPAHAVPDLPSTPDSPDSLDSPDEPESPKTPKLPGEDEPVIQNDQTSTETDTNEGQVEEENNNESQPDSSNNDQPSTETTSTDSNNDTKIQGNVGTTTEDYTKPDTQETSIDNLESVGGYNNNEVSLADLAAGNSNTGADSDNNARPEINNDFDLTATNNLNADNTAYVNVDSGKNSADKNTGDGEVVAGDADIVLTALNVGNNTGVGTQVFNVYDDQTGDLIIDFDNVSSLPLGTVCGDGSATNTTTGSDSNNDATTVCTTQNTILIDNNGNIINDYYLSADTGNNSADKNTGDGSVTTGDVNIVLNVINFINNTFLGGGGELLLGLVNIFGNFDGNIGLNIPNSGDDYLLTSSSAGNSNTGADSDNNASTSSSSDTDIAMTNTADILNNIMLFGDTGNNDASKNTGSGLVTTGDINSNLNVTNISNTNGIGDGGTIWMVLVNNLGNWTGQIWGFDSTGVASPFFAFEIGEDGAFNAITGAGSTNNATVTNNNDTDITMNNNAKLTNNIYINANTGNNSATMNTGNGTISTGDVNVAANIVNILNNNFLASKFVLTIVNVFGSWTGNILPFGWGGSDSDVIADESSSISLEANGVSSNQVGYTPSVNVLGVTSSNNFNSDSNSDKEEEREIATLLTKSEGGAKINSVTKVIGKDAGSIYDYWWVIIPLLVATTSALYRRRFLWKKH
ncbi:hypothetical protein IID23_01345 [Patescibacteria group bacterium]|nr:hypothetical protein [Patescibacteria group bacterium]